ncbi:hypothetical protein PG988_005624 [Apiospora saccharicola]
MPAWSNGERNWTTSVRGGSFPAECCGLPIDTKRLIIQALFGSELIQRHQERAQEEAAAEAAVEVATVSTAEGAQEEAAAQALAGSWLIQGHQERAQEEAAAAQARRGARDNAEAVAVRAFAACPCSYEFCYACGSEWRACPCCHRPFGAVGDLFPFASAARVVPVAPVVPATPFVPVVPSVIDQGAAAGIISQTATYPLEIIRRRVQVAYLAGVSHASITGTSRRVSVEKCLRGLYVGLSVGYVKIAPMTAGADANHAIDLTGDKAGDQEQTSSPRTNGLQRGLCKADMRKSNMFRLYTIPTDNSGVQSR